jgi:hypothetical protein
VPGYSSKALPRHVSAIGPFTSGVVKVSTVTKLPRALMALIENSALQPTPSLNVLVDILVEADRLGIDGVMVSDHGAPGPHHC